MEKIFKIDLPRPIQRLSKVFREAGKLLYLVGGAVRDALMGETPKDYDVATDATPQEVGSILSRAGIRNFPKGEAFGVWVAHMDGEDYEIATFREDIGTADGRRPESVRWCGPAADARRRDLTFNALFYEIPVGEGDGKVLDFFDGQALRDAETRTARVVGDPFDRFREDRLRILRLVRFHSRFSDKEMVLDKRTKEAIEKYGDLRWPTDNLDPISGERIQAEFEAGLLKSKRTDMFLKAYEDLDLLKAVYPSDSLCMEDVDKIAFCKNTKIVMAFLLRHLSGDVVRKELNKLNWPNDIVSEVVFLLKSRITMLYTIAPEGLAHLAQEMCRKPTRRADFKEFGSVLWSEVPHCWRHMQSYYPPAITGEYVMKKYGIEAPGPEVGEKLRLLQADHYRNSYIDHGLEELS